MMVGTARRRCPARTSLDDAMAKIKADLERHKKLFDLSVDHLGRDLCKAATDGAQECIADEKAPDGSAWPPLSEAYDEWKSFHYSGRPMGVLHQVMANPHEVAGEVEVSAERATVTYGVSEQAKAEASWFQEGDQHRPPRRFWGFTDASLSRAREILDARFEGLTAPLPPETTP